MKVNKIPQQKHQALTVYKSEAANFQKSREMKTIEYAIEELHAVESILREREAEHGDISFNTGTISQFWSTYLGRDISLTDVANMMVLLKLARHKGNPDNKDTMCDIIGWASIGAGINSARQSKQ